MRRRGERTYWHLRELGRVPTRYEIASSRLLCYPTKGFAVQTPAAAWYERYQQRSPLTAGDWERFADPEATTYSSYTKRRRDREAYVDELRERLEPEQRALGQAWLDRLRHGFAPLRYPCHGLMMLASYLGSMAPSGRITIAAAFQAADELRRIHCFAYHLAALQQRHPGLGDDARARWQDADAFQPLRRLVERALVTWDFGACFAVLNLVLKPTFDALVLAELATSAHEAGDRLLELELGSLSQDATWHRAWTQALVATALAQHPDNRAVLEGWVADWIGPAQEAIAALAPLLVHGDVAAALERVRKTHHELLIRCGLSEPTAAVHTDRQGG